MSYPPMSEPASRLFLLEKPVTNPRDVAELFDSLDVEHLRYREFQLPDEPTAFDLRPNGVPPRRLPAPASAQPMFLLLSRSR